MNRWATVLLVLLAIGAGVFLWVFEPRMQALRPAEASREMLLRVDPMTVRGIRIRSGGELIELTRKPDGWRLGPEPKDRADAALVGQILELAAQLRIFDTIQDMRSSKDLRRYGLHDSKNRIDIVGDGEATIFFGKDAIGDRRVYVRREDSDTVYVVPNVLEEVAFQSPSAFRDRRLTNLEPSQVDRLVLRRAAGEIEIVRTPQGWALTKPLRALADDEKVEGFLRTLLGTRILAFADAGSAAKGSPSAPGEGVEVLWYPEDQENPDRLWLGAAVERDGRKVVPAFYSARDSGYDLDGALTQIAALTPDSFRDRRLLRLNLDVVDGITISSAGERREWARRGEAWQDSGGDDPVTVADADLGAVARAMADAAVEAFIPATPSVLADAGLADGGRVRVEFDSMVSENTPEAPAGRQSVAVLEIGAEKDGRTPVRINGTPEIAWVSGRELRAFLERFGPPDLDAGIVPAP